MTREDMLAGMREALAQEVDATRKFAAKMSRDAVRGRGRRIRNAKLTLHLNGERLYTVALDGRWQQAEDTLVRIELPNHDPIEGYIEFVEQANGTSERSAHRSNLIITTDKDLPRQLPAGTQVEPAPDLLHQRLCEALETANEGVRNVASKAFGLADAGTPDADERTSAVRVEIPGFLPGKAQQRALDMARTHEVLYVIGPPGTGKTQTLAAMAHQFMLQGLTVLIAAQTNIAVDNAIEQLAVFHDQAQGNHQIGPGAIIRLGQPHLVSLRQRKEFNLPTLATDNLLVTMRERLCTIGQQRAQPEARLEQLERALDKLGQERKQRQEATRAAKDMNLLARVFGGQSRKKLKSVLADLDKQIADLEREKATLIGEVTALTKSDLAARQNISRLERREKMLSRVRESADGAASIAEDELSGELGREMFAEERRILAKARVVGATLTKTYVSKALKDGDEPRRFDVVIVDEASMASLPSLYVTAARADQHVVFIGDPRQLPPIMKSRREVEIAKTWLGRDIFEQARVTLQDAAAGRRHSVLLDEQRRMHPAISRMPGHLIYEDLLRDHPSVSDIPSAIEPLPDHPLVLCDTSQALPQCSKLQSSRLNAYHATCTFVLARRALNSLKRAESNAESNRTSDSGFRVGLITPYRKQADLLQRMIDKEGLQGEMRAGTVHRFQGLECDIVVYDTVESADLDPTSFTKDDETGQARRLINVALTRARQKLIIVANRSYLENHPDLRSTNPAGKGTPQREHTLLKVIREVPETAIIDSLDFVKTAAADLPRSLRTGPSDDIDRAFQIDLQTARHSVVIVSPFATTSRTADMLDMLRPAMDRRVAIHVVTRPSSASPSDVVSRDALAVLREHGVECHADDPALHEKLVFIDETVVYVGSMNALSFGGSTQEVMVRVTDPKVILELRAPYEHWLSARSWS